MADPFEREIQNLYNDWLAKASPAICSRLADQLRQAGRCDESIDIANDGLKQWPDNISINIILGRSCVDSDKLDLATEVFKQVRKLDPLNLIALRNLAEIAFKQEHWSRSIKLLEEYLFECPADADSEKMLNQAKFRKKSDDPSLQESDTEESDTGEDEDNESGLDEYPRTERMAEIFKSQGKSLPEDASPPPVTESESQTSDIVASSNDNSGNIRDPRSLYDLFSVDEKEELHLDEYGSDGE